MSRNNFKRDDFVAEGADVALTNKKDITPAESSHEAKEAGLTGTAIKAEKVASVVESPVNGGAKAMGIDAAGSASSGTGNGFLANQNRTPTADATRALARGDKKVERIANNINSTPSEQAIIATRESKTLREDPSSVQGYNGTPRTRSFRIQKKSGASPAELEYQRSVDFIFKDNVYFADGQTIEAGGHVNDVYPTVSADKYGDYPTSGANFDAKRSNYMLDNIKIKFQNNGQIDHVIYNETELPCIMADGKNLDASSLALPIAYNRADLERQEMDVKAGDEDKEGWSPLPRAIKQPDQVIALMHDMEYITGTELFLAEKKATEAFAFYLNKAVKDGKDIARPGVAFLEGLIDNQKLGSSYSADIKTAFTAAKYRAGSAALMIAAYDSIAKYNNKSDVILQARGPRMHMPKFRHGHDAFKINPKFLRAFNAKEVFGTIDHEYDPLMPLVMTDKCAAIYPLSISQFGSYGPKEFIYTATANNMNISSTQIEFYDAPATMYAFYKITSATEEEGAVALTITNGKTVFAFTHGAANETRAGDVIDVVVSMQDITPDGFTRINTTIPAGTKIQIGEATNANLEIVRDYLGHGSYFYAYSDRRNKYVREVNLPLVTGIQQYLLEMNGKLSSLAQGEIKIIATHSATCLSLYDILLACAADYMAKDHAAFFKDINDYTEANGYPFHDTISLKEAIATSPMGLVNPGYDEPLHSTTLHDDQAFDWKFPELFGYTSKGVLAPWYVCETEYMVQNGALVRNESEFGVCWPSIRAGNHLAGYDALFAKGERETRLAMDRITDVAHGIITTGGCVYKHGLSTEGQIIIKMNKANLTGKALMCMPRELGWSMLAPAGLLTSAAGSCDHNYTETQAGQSCFRTWVYHNPQAQANPVGNVVATLNTGRAADYIQDYAVIDCLSNNGTADPFYGVSLGAGDCLDTNGTPIEGRSKFNVAVTLDGAKTTGNDALELLSDHTNLYFRLQVLPFIINPYDMGNLIDGSAMKVDPFELSYATGLCGFRCSDYSEDVDNRLDECDVQGRLMLEDPWTSASYVKA